MSFTQNKKQKHISKTVRTFSTFFCRTESCNFCLTDINLNVCQTQYKTVIFCLNDDVARIDLQLLHYHQTNCCHQTQRDHHIRSHHNLMTIHHFLHTIVVVVVEENWDDMSLIHQESLQLQEPVKYINQNSNINIKLKYAIRSVCFFLTDLPFFFFLLH